MPNAKTFLAACLLALFSAFFPALFGAQAACELQTKQVAVSHGKIVYSQTVPAATDAAPVVLLHGLFASKEQWQTLMCELAGQGFQVIAPDLPGYGASVDFSSATDYRFAAQTRRLREFLQSLPETARRPQHTVALAGHSMGGAIASRYARRYPESVASLALFAPMGMSEGGGWSAEFRAALRSGKNPMIPLTIAEFEHELSLLLAHPPALPHTDKALAVARYQADLPRYRQVWSVVTLDAPQTCQRHTMPTLVVWGEQERLLTVPTPKAITACLPNSQFLRLPDSGHLLQLDNPAGLAKGYGEFLLGK